MADLGAAGIVPRIYDAIGLPPKSQELSPRHAKIGVDLDVSLAWLPFKMAAIVYQRCHRL